MKLRAFAPHDSNVARYQGPRWNPPAAFEWRDFTAGG